MKYSMYDKFVVRGVLCEVRVINNGMAWVFPCDDTPGANGRTDLACVSFEVLDAKGRGKNGVKAKVVTNVECGAI